MFRGKTPSTYSYLHLEDSYFICNTFPHLVLMSRVIKVPTLNDRLEDFECLFSLYQQAIECGEDLILDFSRCNFLRHNAVAFIGGLVRTIQCEGRSVRIEWNSIP
jgi:hypothetical protein